MLQPYEVFVGLRYTRAKRRNHFISFISLISMLGIALGVTALITVMSVMNGFEKEVRERILGMASHAEITLYRKPMHNWEKLAEFCKNFTVLTLCGHTHDDQEFRLGDPGEFKTQVYDAPPFKLKKIENPAAIYYDNYSEIDDNAKAISNNCPYVVQTPALGLGSYGHPKSAGAFREVIVQNGKLSSFKVKYINR